MRLCNTLGLINKHSIFEPFESTEKNIEKFMEDQAFPLTYDLAPPLPPPRQQVVSLSSFCLSWVALYLAVLCIF
jgi:hypothetical protein